MAEEEKPKWYDGFSDEMKGNETITAFETPEALAQAFLDKPGAPEVPKDVDGYTVPEKYPIKGLRKFAHESGMTQAQLDSIVKFNTERQETFSKAAQEVATKSADALKKEWGEDFEDNVNVARQLVTKFDTESGEFAKFLKDTKTGNAPVVVKFMHAIGVLMKEGGFLKADGKPTKEALTIAEKLYPNQGKE